MCLNMQEQPASLNSQKKILSRVEGNQVYKGELRNPGYDKQ